MKKLLTIVIFVSSVSGMAFTPKLVTKKIKTYSVEISKNCKNNCFAVKAIEKLTAKHFQQIKNDVYGGKTFGNIICRKVFKAQVKYYRDKKKNERHFCLFDDGSYLPTGEFDYLESDLAAK